MIDENKLVMEIANWQMSLCPEYSDRDKAIWEALQEVIEAIDEQPKIGEWISCSERLPEPYDTVLLTGKMLEDKEPLVYMGCINGKKEWQLLGVGNPFDYITTAWQPLPGPWKRGSETWEQNQAGL